MNKQKKIVIAVIMINFCGYCFGFNDGDGSSSNPYQIATVEDLLSIGTDPNLLDKHYILISDIDLDPNLPGGQVFTNALIAPDPENPYLEDGGAFTGSFNGNNFTIKNIKIHNDNESDLGIFGYIGEGGRVVNFNIVDAEIKGNSNIGIIAGVNWGTISNCSVTGLINGEEHTGGLVGSNGNSGPPRCPCPYWKEQVGLIEKCYSECTIKSQQGVGGLVGENTRGNITSSYANCEIHGTNSIGGIIGSSWRGEIYSCYALGNISGKNYTGGLIGSNYYSSIFACYSQANINGIKFNAGLVGGNEDGTIFCCYASGHVISENEAAGLVSVNEHGFVHSCFWDIESTGATQSSGGEGKTTNQMQLISTFDGWEFIEQWKIDNQNDYPRLSWQDLPGQPITDQERCYSGGTGEPNSPYLIETIEDVQTISEYIGDWSKHFLLVQDINIENTQTNTPAPIGLPPIPFTGVFDGNDHIIKGLSYNIQNEEYVSLFRYVGYEDADPNLLNGIICNLHLSDVNIIGTEYVSGLVSLNRGLIQSCSVSGYIRTEKSAGGLVAENLGIVSGCSDKIDVLRYDKGSRGIGDIGGLIAFNKGNVYNCNSSGYVDGKYGSSNTGGLIGYSYGGEIINSFSSVDVNSFRSSGGLVGSAIDTEIICCYATGDVNSLESGDNVDTGGLAGSMYGILMSSYSSGKVSGGGYTGSLVGQNGGTIAMCYATGEVNGSGISGGLVADNFFGITYLSYWDYQSTGLNNSNGGKPKTTEQMMRKETFRGWGYNNYWKISDGVDYPRLFWEDSQGEPITDEPRLYGGGTGTLDNPYQILSAEDLATIGWHLEDFNKCFILITDINITDIDPNNILPIGTEGIPFTGVFNGNGNTIFNFELINPNKNFMGLFGVIGDSEDSIEYETQVMNVTLVDANIIGLDYVGILAGVNRGVITNCHVSGSVKGHWQIAGLAGSQEYGAMSFCSSNSDISGDYWIAGLVGYNSYGYIYGCYGQDNIFGNKYVGGLLGDNFYGTLSNCYSMSNILSTSSAGGLVEDNQYGGLIENCYFAGRIIASESAAGLVLNNVSSDSRHGTIKLCFWDVELSGITDGVFDQELGPEGGIGLSTSQMKKKESFVNWDFDEIWDIAENQTYPFLR